MAIVRTLKPLSGRVLTRANYEFCSIKMKTFLHLKKCRDMVETKFKELDATVVSAMSNAQKIVVEACQDQDLRATWCRGVHFPTDLWSYQCISNLESTCIGIREPIALKR